MSQLKLFACMDLMKVKPNSKVNYNNTVFLELVVLLRLTNQRIQPGLMQGQVRDGHLLAYTTDMLPIKAMPGQKHNMRVINVGKYTSLGIS